MLDFDCLYTKHSTLQGCRVTINEVCETEAVKVSFPHDSPYKSMTLQKLHQLFGKHHRYKDVFACLDMYNQNTAEIEFMNTESTSVFFFC